MRSLLLSFFTLTLICDAAEAQWVRQQSGTTARLRGLAVVDKNVVWASGTQGTFVLTTNGGATWKASTVPGAIDLDFRDVHAFDASRAFLLSIGEGEKSRVYQSIDGGATWALRFINRDPNGFLDAIAFWDADHAIVMGDAVDGRFTILTTDDGGASWKLSPRTQMPLALKGEGAFAASGTCLIVQGERNAWFATGGASVARVFRSTDRGQSWTVHDTPVAASSVSAGIFSLAFHDAQIGVAIGGDFKAPTQATRLVAKTTDGGVTWSTPAGRGPSGYRSAVSYVPQSIGKLIVAAGPTGSDLSSDGGETWTPLSKLGFHAIGFVSTIDGGWGVGDNGTIARYQGSVERKGQANGDQADPPAATSR